MRAVSRRGSCGGLALLLVARVRAGQHGQSTGAIEAAGGWVQHWRGPEAITVGEGKKGEHRCPGCLAPAKIRPGTRAETCRRVSLPGRYSRGLTRVSLASLVMASSFPRCEIRQLAVYVYPGGIKAHDAERFVVFYGRRGVPVKKPRFIPAQLAHQLARKLQAKRLGTVAVL